MHTGSLPPATIWGTWSENVEVWSVDDDTLMDLSGLIEVTLKLRDWRTGFDELTLTMSAGDITIPSTGIIQWRADKTIMGTLSVKLYEVLLLLENEDDTVPVILGSISIME